MKAATVVCQQMFLVFALAIFLLKFLCEVFQNRLFFALASRSGFGAAILVVITHKKASLCNLFFCKSYPCAHFHYEMA